MWRLTTITDIPDVPGLDTFKGEIHHSSFWPAEGVDYKGKKVAVIGTGASGVQMVQEMGPQAEQLTVYQRTPNLALPMGKRDLTKAEQDGLKPNYPYMHALRELTFAGFHYDLCERKSSPRVHGSFNPRAFADIHPLHRRDLPR